MLSLGTIKGIITFSMVKEVMSVITTNANIC